MTEEEKCAAGLWYDTTFEGREEEHEACDDLCWEYNNTRPTDLKKREEIIRKLFGKIGKNPYIEPTIWCGFGSHIEAGDNFYANNNCVFVDPAKITFGNDVFIGPNCGFYTAVHPRDYKYRNRLLEKAEPIKVGDNVWFGGTCVVLPGVTIGSNVVIGAGSVVASDIPDGVVAYGNPCIPRHPIGEGDAPEIEAQFAREKEEGNLLK